MISFWVDAAGSFGMERYLETRAQQLVDRIQVRRYEHLTSDFEVPAGAHSPYQSEAWKPGNPASAVVGISLAAVLRFFAVIA